MPKIEEIDWAKVKINGKNYWQVLIIGDEVVVREVERVKEEYGTDHVVASWEQDLLFSKNPEVIVIANGWGGVLKVDEKLKMKTEKLGIKLEVLRTPEAVKKYNWLVEEGKKVNALIHTTC